MTTPVILLIELIVVLIWMLMLTVSHFREMKRLTFISMTRYSEIETSSMMIWALVDRLQIDDKELTQLVHDAQEKVRKTCQCRRCTEWREDHTRYNDKMDREELKALNYDE